MLYWIGNILGVMLGVVVMASLARLFVVVGSKVIGRVRDRFRIEGYLMPAVLIGTAVSVAGVGEGNLGDRLTRPGILQEAVGILAVYACAAALVYGIAKLARRGRNIVTEAALDEAFRAKQKPRAPIQWAKVGRGTAELLLFVIVGGVAFEAVLGGTAVLGIIAGGVVYFLYRRQRQA